MMMFLTLLGFSLLAVVVLSAIVYGTSPRGAAPRSETQPHALPTLGAPHFFGADFAGPAARPEVPLDAVIAQIERHVRLEQAAAESFLELPTPETLYMPTASRFVH